MLIWGGSVAAFAPSQLVRDAAAYTVACESQGTPPVARCNDVETAADATCKASVEPSAVDDGSSDAEDGVDLTRSLDPAGPYPLGTTPVTLTVTDSDDMSGSCEANVVVSDATEPTITDAVASPAVLFPANQKWRRVAVRYDANDNCSSDELACSLSVTSNEPDRMRPSDPSPDWIVIDEHEVWLRAQRFESGDGRVYTIRVHCTDAGGNSSTREATVTVPIGLVIEHTSPPVSDSP
jgi:hypothetical protein